MPIPKKFNLTPREYHNMHARLRRKFSKIAFDAHFQCARCGSHKDIEMHIPDPNPAKEDQPGFVQFLCEDCHRRFF